MILYNLFGQLANQHNSQRPQCSKILQNVHNLSTYGVKRILCTIRILKVVQALSTFLYWSHVLNQVLSENYSGQSKEFKRSAKQLLKMLRLIGFKGIVT